MIVPHLQDFFERLARFPWRNTAHTLRQRFREDRLGQTAGSLTFTTTIALVPMVTVALAVLTAFPMFGDFQVILQKRLVESLVPDNISRQVLGYLTQFASKASRLGAAGVTALLLSALALVFTIDRTLNAIWRVRKRRPLAHSMLLYWTAITLGPLLMGASLVMMSQFVAVSRGVVPDMAGNLRWVFSLLEFFLLAWGECALPFCALYPSALESCLGRRRVGGGGHRSGTQSAGVLLWTNAHLFGAARRICHRTYFVDLDLFGLVHCVDWRCVGGQFTKPVGWYFS